MSAPQVKYTPESFDEIRKMRKGKGPRTRKKHGDQNIEAHHRQQKSIEHNDGVMDELTEKTHRRDGNHTRHDKASEIDSSQRAKEIREHYKERGQEYRLPEDEY